MEGELQFRSRGYVEYQRVSRRERDNRYALNNCVPLHEKETHQSWIIVMLTLRSPRENKLQFAFAGKSFCEEHYKPWISAAWNCTHSAPNPIVFFAACWRALTGGLHLRIMRATCFILHTVFTKGTITLNEWPLLITLSYLFQHVFVGINVVWSLL